MADDVFLHRTERIEQLIQELERSDDPAVQIIARELVDNVLALHRVALGHLIAILSKQNAVFHDAITNAAAEDALVNNLLLLHNLHPIDLRKRVVAALEQILPSLPQPDTIVEIEEVSPTLVRLRFEAPSDPGTCISMQRMLEDALLIAAPDVAVVECRATISTGRPGYIPLPILTTLKGAKT